MIKIQDLTKKFNGRTVLNGVSFEVKEGEVFGYLGPNGAGKTTTLRIILGLLKPTSGTALVEGRNLGEDEELRQRVGVVLESDGLYERLTAHENLDYYARLYGVAARSRSRAGRRLEGERVEELLEFVGLSERRNEKVGKFSTGMKRKLALARALIHEPEILFLDEPATGLDPEAQRMVRDLILKLSKEEKRTVFLNSHDLDEVQRICTRIAILQNGELRAYDSVENLRRRFSRPVVEVAFADSEEAARALQVVGSLEQDFVADCELEREGRGKGVRLRVALKQKQGQGQGAESPSRLLERLVRAGVKVEELKRVEKSLEEVYLEIVRQTETDRDGGGEE
ncbi:MAG: ABC transporter ATP-binding protein [Candidatus Methanophagaceae archaeon]|nr:MAG: ABC transporter ATP-binding protein [Methanophagales archaeon]